MTSADKGFSVTRQTNGPYFSRYTNRQLTVDSADLSPTHRAYQSPALSPSSTPGQNRPPLIPALSPTSLLNYGLIAENRRNSEGNQQRPTSGGAETTRQTSNQLLNSEYKKAKTRGRFANVVSKHSASILAVATLQEQRSGSRKKALVTNSCPNLVAPFSGKTSGADIKQINSDSELQSKHKPDLAVSLSQAGVSRNNLKVPDLFTTSFTHSKTATTDSVKPAQKSAIYTLSLQDIPDSVRRQSKKLSLRRTISLTKDDNLKIAHLLSVDMYRDEQVAQVTDYLFVGSIESAYNERRLCRLDIESLVDISNMSEMQVPSNKKTQCPCLCQTDFKHFRSRLIIAVADDEKEDIGPYFDEVNRFIEAARRCGRKVLVYSYEGKSRAVVFAMQYLMSYENLLLRQAYNLIKKQRPCVALNPGFQKALETLEKSLFPDAKPSVNICNEYLNVADPQAIKCAWIDC